MARAEAKRQFPRAGVCGQCGGAFEQKRATHKFCSKACTQADYRARRPEQFAWTEAKKAGYHRRRARKHGTTTERFTSLEVFERDGWCCQLCGGPVDPAVAWPDPLSASLDHVVPLSRGGPHTRDNSQLAHLRCNVQKGAKEADDDGWTWLRAEAA